MTVGRRWENGVFVGINSAFEEVVEDKEEEATHRHGHRNQSGVG